MSLRTRPVRRRPEAAACPATDRRLRALRVVGAGTMAVYLLCLLVGRTGDRALLHLMLSGGYAACMGVVALLAVGRAVLFTEDRLAWSCLGAGLTCYLVSSVLDDWYDSAGAVHPVLSEVGWVAFYPLAYVALGVVLRARVRGLTRSTWFDGLVAGLTTAACGAYAVARVAVGSDLAAVARATVYPVGDTVLLLVVAWGAAVLGRHAGPAWWWLTAGIALFALSDVGYAVQVARGLDPEGGLLDAGYGAAFIAVGAAVCQRPRGPGRRSQGRAGLVLPLGCALAALLLLLHGYLTQHVPHRGDALAGVLALVAVVAALARTSLTFREVRALAESRREARTDELTGLPNRRSVVEELEAQQEQLTASGRLAVLVVDLDRFKEVNDSLGHAAGDAVLRQVGPRLAARLRPDDVLGRMGGDEFVVLLHDVDVDEALLVAERLVDALRTPFVIGALALTVDASTGVAVGPLHSSSPEELLQMADLAMYAAKTRSLGVACFDAERDGSGRHRLEHVEQLRAGIRAGELVLHFQPKLDLRSGEVAGVEALVRWAHPTRGLLYPDAFIDLAESAGLMPALTGAVLELALAQCGTWRAAGLDLGVAVNVSTSNLVDEGFPVQVADALRRHGLPPTSLVLEVTESVLMADRDRAVDVLTRLRCAGVGIAIDDYGTGYSSLAYLAALPVTELKLDRSFLAAVLTCPRTATVVTSTLQLAQSLGLEVVAEGVEDQETLDLLVELGCDLVQGYHVSRPQPPDALAAWLRARAGVPVA